MREVGALVAAGPVAGQLGHVHVTVGRGGRGGGEGAHAGGGRHPGPARRIFSNEQETLGDTRRLAWGSPSTGGWGRAETEEWSSSCSAGRSRSGPPGYH